ncbi:MAG TPA: hypothetical protein VGF99_20700, partial [Myxococcota bacterium]
AIRGREESAARAIAESCADRMFAYSTSYIKEIAAGEAQPPADFDRLLDPDGIGGNGDDYLPPGTATTTVPPGSASAFHRFRVLRLDGGACLVRFDDNSDDWHPGLGDRSTGNNTIIEGPAAADDVANRDRDRSIWVAVIGVYPAFDTTPDSELWLRAHARVSIRRFLETAGGPAVWAGDRITITDGSTAICGLGGMRSDTVTRGTDNVCACGHQKHDNIADAIGNECNYINGPGDACDDRTRACEPNLKEESPQPAPQGTELPTPTSFKTVPRPTVHGDACSIWARDKDAPEPAPKTGTETTYVTSAGMPAGADAMAFIWVGDSARSTGAVAGAVGALGLNGVCDTLLGNSLAACPSAAAETCAESPPTNAPPPCRYEMAMSGGQPNGLTLKECRVVDGVRESRCWVPVAVLDGTKTTLASNSQSVIAKIVLQLRNLLPASALLLAPLELALGVLGVSLNETLAALAAGLTEDIVGIGEQTVIIGGVERLALQKYEANLVVKVGALTINTATLPLLGAVVSGLVTTLTTPLLAGEMTMPALCGGGCTGSGDCSGQPLLFVSGSKLTTDTGFESQRSAPKGVTLMIENGNDTLQLVTATKASGTVADDKPLRMAVRAQGNVDWRALAVACCPTCRCPGDPARAAMVVAGVEVAPALPAVPLVLPKRRATNATPGTPGSDCDGQAGAIFLPDADGGRGLRSLLHSDRSCRINGASTLIGRISCANVTVLSGGADDTEHAAGGCFVGGVDGRATCGVDTPCAAPIAATPATDYNTCSGSGAMRVAGCDDPGVCIEGSVGIVGSVRSATDVCVLRNTTVYGQLIGLDDVALTRSVIVNHDNAGSIGAITQAQAWIEAYP